MENMFFSRRSKRFKENKIKRVLCSKIPMISEENIDNILCSLDFEKQYYVKAFRNPKKFLNILTDEKVCRQEASFESKCFVVYGDCLPGSFTDVNGERSHIKAFFKNDSSMAAIKAIAYPSFDNVNRMEHMLVVYEPMGVNAVFEG